MVHAQPAYGPAQAVSLYCAMGEPVSIPIHWGVFELADESLDAPPEMLLNALQSAGLREDRFSLWKIGARQALNAIYQKILKMIIINWHN